FQIRTEEHLNTAKALVERIVSASGYAAATFGIHAERVTGSTATEIINRERRSFITRSKKISYFDLPLRQIMAALLTIDATQFDGQGIANPKVRVKWPDTLQEDPKET